MPAARENGAKAPPEIVARAVEVNPLRALRDILPLVVSAPTPAARRTRLVLPRPRDRAPPLLRGGLRLVLLLVVTRLPQVLLLLDGLVVRLVPRPMIDAALTRQAHPASLVGVNLPRDARVAILVGDPGAGRRTARARHASPSGTIVGGAMMTPVGASAMAVAVAPRRRTSADGCCR